MVEEPLGENFSAALPGNVCATPGQETGDCVAAKVMDPAFGCELAHEGIDEGEACLPVLPALEPRFGQRGVNGIGRSLAAKACGWVDVVAEMPRYETAVAVVLCLVEDGADAALRAKVHVAKEELACEAGGWLAWFAFEVVDNVLCTPEDLAAADAAKVEMW